jgi:hypothetical protein
VIFGYPFKFANQWSLDQAKRKKPPNFGPLLQLSKVQKPVQEKKG